ncbi:hypothetical protein A1OE_695 [Candidatus Endolissoclinum faulkneri L2]|uniref:Uncharacterized protein n=1 Tax=Candidatus Endolissoclinum faulkneri L2 TaxID=1193729 RepID=K7Z4E4_9PROT|nr:hypothetical protein A1OE_695 [Candidatus Endolissoclinum faulkneri L2]
MFFNKLLITNNYLILNILCSSIFTQILILRWLEGDLEILFCDKE